MGKIIAITNQKGGVGKTTTCVNLAAALSACQRRVLLIDLDPQGNATMGSGVDKQQLPFTINDVLLEFVDLKEVIISAKPAGFNLLPANGHLTNAEIKLLELDQREYRLQLALQPIIDEYDAILIDCPPALNILTINALVAADSVLVPVQCEYYALEGLASLMETIDQIRTSVNSKLQIEGILRTLYDGRNRLAIEVSEQLSNHFGTQLYQTVIPRNIRLAEAPSFGLPGLIYDKKSQGAVAYTALAEEILKRWRQQSKA